jgi:hypothetical protein
MRFTQHALERFQIHHPHAQWEDLEAAHELSTDLNPELALSITGRKAGSHRGSTYTLSSDGSGIFVIAPQGNIVITYLRLSLFQRNWVKKNILASKTLEKMVDGNTHPLFCKGTEIAGGKVIQNWLGGRKKMINILKKSNIVEKNSSKYTVSFQLHGRSHMIDLIVHEKRNKTVFTPVPHCA